MSPIFVIFLNCHLSTLGVALKGATSFSCPSKGKSAVAVRRALCVRWNGLLHASIYSRYGSKFTSIDNCSFSVASQFRHREKASHWPKTCHQRKEDPDDLTDSSVQRYVALSAVHVNLTAKQATCADGHLHNSFALRFNKAIVDNLPSNLSAYTQKSHPPSSPWRF